MNLGLKLHWKALWVCVLAICHCRAVFAQRTSLATGGEQLRRHRARLRKTSSRFRRSENGLPFRDRIAMKLEPALHRKTLCVYMLAHFATASKHGA